MRLRTATRAVARAMIGSTFVALGYDAFHKPGGRVDLAAGTLAAIRRAVPLPQDDEVIVRANAAVQTVSGVLLALGVAPRLAAAAIAGSLVPTTVAGHAFWAIDDPVRRKQQRVQFHKNVALLGGLALVILDRSGSRRAAE